MGIIRDMMAPFELRQPATLDDAAELVADLGGDGWVLAGGLDSFDWMKDRIKRPKVVVDLGGVAELRTIEERADGGLVIGAGATLTEVIRHPLVAERWPLLAEAARQVATPQIRNQGTLGGNIAQDTRCWYYRSGWPCYRAGGNTCYAAAPRAMNREHCILGASRCVAVSPSDTAPALVALGARMRVRRGGRERVHDAEDFFIGPAIDITRMTVLEDGDLLVAVELPPAVEGARHYFEKVRDRGSWDFPLANVAAVFAMDGTRIAHAGVAVGAVAPYPVRLEAVERLLQGRAVDEELAREAGEVAVRGARSLRHNDYKVPLMRNLVRRAVRSAAG